jgi:hypothetical protein
MLSKDRRRPASISYVLSGSWRCVFETVCLFRITFGADFRWVACSQKLLDFPKIRLDSYIPSLLALLKPVMFDRITIEASCRVWLRALKLLSKDTLCEYFVPIVVTLLSVFPSDDDTDTHPDEGAKLDGSDSGDALLLAHVVDVLRYVVRDRLEDVKDVLNRIPCVPRCHILDDVLAVGVSEMSGFSLCPWLDSCLCVPIKQRVISHLAEQSLLDSIRQLTALLRNDMLAVKRMALVQIERQVTKNASQVKQLWMCFWELRRYHQSFWLVSDLLIVLWWK